MKPPFPIPTLKRNTETKSNHKHEIPANTATTPY